MVKGGGTAVSRYVAVALVAAGVAAVLMAAIVAVVVVVVVVAVTTRLVVVPSSSDKKSVSETALTLGDREGAGDFRYCEAIVAPAIHEISKAPTNMRECIAHRCQVPFRLLRAGFWKVPRCSIQP